ncbi:PREDICTED: protein POF1B [Ficedula albicollis]|uniref:protein POF1B n=1 Tax=Ficedula albicollis TaxID=59894 RepID=UPI0007AD8FD8|nr:PREDICTED: protein POF1B [Ficedula albicollis]
MLPDRDRDRDTDRPLGAAPGPNPVPARDEGLLRTGPAPARAVEAGSRPGGPGGLRVGTGRPGPSAAFPLARPLRCVSPHGEAAVSAPGSLTGLSPGHATGPSAVSPFSPLSPQNAALAGSVPARLGCPGAARGTIRRIIIENPDQEPLSPFLRGASFSPGNNVIYEKTIRKYELLNPLQERQFPPCPAEPCPQCPPAAPPPLTQQCRQTQTGSPCELCPGPGSDECRAHPVRRGAAPPELVSCPQDTPEQLDCRFFGELLAELHRKSTDLYSCLLQHVEKIGTRNHDIEFTCQTEDIEELIPKGLSEATKQQIRYLLQMRATSDKSLRLVLSTFKNLREELCHLQDDLGKLETDNVLLKKDLAFKDSQVKEYETMLASLRENNRQQQQGLRDSTARCRSLEEQLLSLRLSEGDKECQLKELEYSRRALEQEIQSLKLQSCSSPSLQTTTDELSSRYVEMINNLREDKDREIRSLRSQLCQFQQDITRREGSNSDLQMRLHELTSLLEDKEAFIKQQQEELFRLKHEKLSGSQSPGVTAIITKKYRNQYPILGLLSDDYKVTSPVNKSQTIVIERTGEIWKHE